MGQKCPWVILFSPSQHPVHPMLSQSLHGVLLLLVHGYTWGRRGSKQMEQKYIYSAIGDEIFLSPALDMKEKAYCLSYN